MERIQEERLLRMKAENRERRSVINRAKKPQTTNHNEDAKITRPSIAQTKIAPRAHMGRPLEIIRMTQGSSKILPTPATLNEQTARSQ